MNHRVKNRILDNPRRKSIRLRGYHYSGERAYFVTICVYEKECLFGNVIDDVMQLNDYGRIAESEWLNTGKIRQNITLDNYIIMPNHIHGIIEISGTVGATGAVAPTKSTLKANTLGSIIGQFKSVTTKKIRKTGLTRFQWQRNYYDHIIRNENELNAIREYIMLNPLKWEIDRENPENWRR